MIFWRRFFFRNISMTDTYTTQGGIQVTRTKTMLEMATALDAIYDQIDSTRGGIFASDYEFPGRYSRWDIGFINPPLEMISRGREFVFHALNERGKALLKMITTAVINHPHIESSDILEDRIIGSVIEMPSSFPEEERSKQPSIFSILRGLCDLFKCEDEYLSMFGAFGYDLVFQFEPVDFKFDRTETGADCHLFLPDRLRAIDHQKEVAFELSYEFEFKGISTSGLSDLTESAPYGNHPSSTEIVCDHQPNEFAEKVEKIRKGCHQGDFFEVVLSQEFTVECGDKPSEIFQRVRKQNPSPYEFIINLGDEQLVGASPEMFVRVDDKEIETCPISGTVRRGTNPMDDAKQILWLLNSKKDESELTMCTDVDRNDKSRICVPGSVQLVARRLVETYSKLFHTVDHVKGTLLDDCDMFDAFLSHMWACTLTGSPKPIAMQTIENLENSPRRWYGGCVGFFNFMDQLNTGITIRTIHLHDGKASVRAGATLLFDSDPESEENETRVKAEAFINAITTKTVDSPETIKPIAQQKKHKLLFVDNQDSFVHTIANYVRQTGHEVITLRAGFDESRIDDINPDLIFISPGPGTPEQMGVPQLVGQAVHRKLPIFGVCLGHQGIGQHFGGEICVLPTPVHGKDSPIHHEGKGIFKDIPSPFMAGRYHSLYIKKENLPDCFEITAETEDGIIMGLQHKDLPIASVQFHPESILTLHDQIGLKLIFNAMDLLL